jgi:hypothetical protein
MNRQTSEFTSTQIIHHRYGQDPEIWSFTVKVTNIEAGKWNTRDVNGNLASKCAYLVQSDISITNSKQVNKFQLCLWHAPLLTDGTIDPDSHLKHCGPEYLKGEVVVLHRTRETGRDATIEAGTEQARLQTGIHTTNNRSYDINVCGGLKTTHEIQGERQKITCEVSERTLNNSDNCGVPHIVRVYALIVCSQAVKLDISAEVDITWRKSRWSRLKNPVILTGPWCEITLPEVPKGGAEQDFSTWGQEEFKEIAGNSCVTGYGQLFHYLN